MGCQEKMYDNQELGSLKITRAFCPNVSIIRYTRYVGVGTFMIFITLFLLFCSITV